MGTETEPDQRKNVVINRARVLPAIASEAARCRKVAHRGVEFTDAQTAHRALVLLVNLLHCLEAEGSAEFLGHDVPRAHAQRSVEIPAAPVARLDATQRRAVPVMELNRGCNREPLRFAEPGSAPARHARLRRPIADTFTPPPNAPT